LIYGKISGNSSDDEPERQINSCFHGFDGFSDAMLPMFLQTGLHEQERTMLQFDRVNLQGVLWRYGEGD
jgi:hypothetical protein